MNTLFHCFGLHKTVDLPPQKLETDTTRLLRLDRIAVGSKDGKDGADKNKLKIEELECGVQFESSDSARQEWSFTLYDFDGHGRITKEDLASLLKALYDAVGSSIRLPPNGAKTLKLRLSVGQDCTTQIQNVTSQKAKNTNKVTKNKVREFSKLNNLARAQVKCTNENQAALSSAVTNQEAAAINQNQQDARTQNQALKHGANRLSLKDHHQLADPEQENPEQNQIRQLRKNRADGRNDQHHHHKRQHRSSGHQCPITSLNAAQSAMGAAPPTTESPGDSTQLTQQPATDERSQESQDRRNYYSDLVGVENNSSKFQNNPQVPLPSLSCVQTVSGNQSHEVSKSAKLDSLPVSDKCESATAPPLEKCDNIQRETEQQVNKLVPEKTDLQHFQSKSYNLQPVGHMQSPKTRHKQHNVAVNSDSVPNRFRPVSLHGHLPITEQSSCHRRHRQREKERNMAMQQVAEWIEREHAWDVDRGPVVVQRHEHHHIHEHHHHHHFHHHYET